jgi:hypothetical protein
MTTGVQASCDYRTSVSLPACPLVSIIASQAFSNILITNYKRFLVISLFYEDSTFCLPDIIINMKMKRPEVPYKEQWRASLERRKT